MGAASRFGIRASLLFSLLFFSLFAQTGEEQIGAVTAALRAGEFAKALELLQPALEKSPANARFLTLQGLAYSGEGQKKEALTSFHAGLKASPDYLPALEGAAQIEYEDGSAEAVPLLQRILRLRPCAKASTDVPSSAERQKLSPGQPAAPTPARP